MIWILYKNMLMLFSAVLLNFILGTIIYIIWKLLGRLAESKGYVEEDRTISISVSSGDYSTFWNKEERIVWF